MKFHLEYLFLSIIIFTSCSSKKLIFSEKNKKVYLMSNFSIDSTTLIATKKNTTYPYKYNLNSSSESKKNNDIYFSKVGLDVNFVINFGKYPNPKILLFSDYNQYDGSHTKEVELSKFNLIINKDKVNTGDVLMGRIICETEENKYTKPITIKGDFIHTIGTSKIVLKNGKVIFEKN